MKSQLQKRYLVGEQATLEHSLSRVRQSQSQKYANILVQYEQVAEQMSMWSIKEKYRFLLVCHFSHFEVPLEFILQYQKQKVHEDVQPSVFDEVFQELEADFRQEEQEKRNIDQKQKLQRKKEQILDQKHQILGQNAKVEAHCLHILECYKNVNELECSTLHKQYQFFLLCEKLKRQPPLSLLNKFLHKTTSSKKNPDQIKKLKTAAHYSLQTFFKQQQPQQNPLFESIDFQSNQFIGISKSFGQEFKNLKEVAQQPKPNTQGDPKTGQIIIKERSVWKQIKQECCSVKFCFGLVVTFLCGLMWFLVGRYTKSCPACHANSSQQNAQ